MNGQSEACFVVGARSDPGVFVGAARRWPPRVTATDAAVRSVLGPCVKGSMSAESVNELTLLKTGPNGQALHTLSVHFGDGLCPLPSPARPTKHAVRQTLIAHVSSANRQPRTVSRDQ